MRWHAIEVSGRPPIEWNSAMPPDELRKQAKKAERRARSLESEANRLRALATHLQKWANDA